MSLVGNLADLGLGEILQIISLSQKSGTLQLATARDTGAIGFVQGKVVFAQRDQRGLSISDMLIEQKLASASQVQEMMNLQAQKPHAAQSQPPVLWESFSLSIDAVEGALRGQIEKLVYEMFDWEEGNFSFVVADDPKALTRVSVASNAFTVMRGLNPQFLAMEGARLRDERQRSDPFKTFMARSEKADAGPPPATAEKPAGAVQARAERTQPAAPDAPAEKPPAEVKPPVVTPAPEVPTITPNADAPPAKPSTTPVAAPEPRAAEMPSVSAAVSAFELVLIDDDPNLLRLLREKLLAVFPSVNVFTKVEAGLKRTRELLWANKRVVVVSDLILPRSDGAGILGGLEVLEKIRPDYPQVPVYLLTDFPNEEANQKARALNVNALVQKPRRAELEKDKTKTVLDQTATTLIRELAAYAEATPEAPDTGVPSADEEAPMNTERIAPIERSKPIDAVEPPPERTARVEPIARSWPADDAPTAEMPALQAAEKVSEKPSEKPADKTAERPAEKPERITPPVLTMPPVVTPQTIIKPMMPESGLRPVVPVLAEQPDLDATPTLDATPDLDATPLPPEKPESKTGTDAKVEANPEAPTKPHDAEEHFDISFDDDEPALPAGSASPIPERPPARDQHVATAVALNADPMGLAELSREIGLELSQGAIEESGEQDRPMVMLKSLLFELMSPASRDTIMLLVLRYASELFSRSTLLLVARDELWGLGGYSHQVKNVDFISLVRRLRARLDPEGRIASVIKHKASARVALDAVEPERELAQKLGIDPSRPVFIAPLVSADRVAAILLGDNQQMGKDLGDTHGLEIFLLQAGMAMERALLERRLRELARGGAKGSGPAEGA